MAPARSYDEDELIRLLVEDPYRPHYEIARLLTEYNRAHGTPREVRVGTVDNAIHKLRPRLEELGIFIPNRNNESPTVRELKRRTGHRTLTEEINLNDLSLRRLRQLDRLSKGLPVADREATKARSWEKMRRHEKTVVDIRENGSPVVRPAMPWELDANGKLRELIVIPEPPDAPVAPDLGDSVERDIWSLALPVSEKAKLIITYRKGRGFRDIEGVALSARTLRHADG